MYSFRNICVRTYAYSCGRASQNFNKPGRMTISEDVMPIRGFRCDSEKSCESLAKVYISTCLDRRCFLFWWRSAGRSPELPKMFLKGGLWEESPIIFFYHYLFFSFMIHLFIYYFCYLCVFIYPLILSDFIMYLLFPSIIYYFYYSFIYLSFLIFFSLLVIHLV